MNTKLLIAAVSLTNLLTTSVFAQEITVQNDSLVDGGTVAICPCFSAGEEAAVWLTSPCDGNIVALQFFWKSQFGGAPQTLEDSLIVYEGGSFPFPGPIKDSFLGPVMTDGGLNEFRYEDEDQLIPISIPVSAGEEFVVSLRFGVANANQLFAASVASDDSGCQPGKNAVKVNGTTWTNACALGVSGDWVIRAVIDCTGAPTGAACLPDGSCVEDMTEEDTIALGGFWNGIGTECADVGCEGACYISSTETCLQFDLATCDAVGGTWAGPGTVDCVLPCAADMTGDGIIDISDVFAFLSAYNTSDLAADLTNDGVIDISDVFAFLELYNSGCL